MGRWIVASEVTVSMTEISTSLPLGKKDMEAGKNQEEAKGKLTGKKEEQYGKKCQVSVSVDPSNDEEQS